MHIPDGFLSTPAWVSTWVLSFGGLAYCVRKTKEVLQDKVVPLMGVMAAFIFAAQMLNFPVLGGTSGHLLGGVLAAILLGPYAAAIVLSCVLIVQCIVFQDGGLTALGANIFNMSIIGTMGGYCVYLLMLRIFNNNKKVLIAAGIAAWVSVMCASGLCAVELALSGMSPFKVVLPAMLFVHAFIGIGEAIITMLVISFVLKVRPDLIYNTREAPHE
ncbi:MAG: energy-coupling factor ABC transporter permease [Candidatus Ancaeobacter aquaticus]|nr:energy-coupling factor ABC transporter permease [Candidatus Ancaeobacter aquaticus]